VLPVFFYNTLLREYISLRMRLMIQGWDYILRVHLERHTIFLSIPFIRSLCAELLQWKDYVRNIIIFFPGSTSWRQFVLTQKYSVIFFLDVYTKLLLPLVVFAIKKVTNLEWCMKQWKDRTFTFIQLKLRRGMLEKCNNKKWRRNDTFIRVEQVCTN